MINIREYKENDKEKVVQLIKKTIFEIFKKEARDIEDLSNIKKEYFEKGGIFYIAEENEQLIGTIAVKKERGSVARLKRMYVDKRYRNQKIGQRLFDKVLEFCKNKGYKKIVLSTCPEMKEAIEFYKKNGFKGYKKGKQILLRLFLSKSIKKKTN